MELVELKHPEDTEPAASAFRFAAKTHTGIENKTDFLLQLDAQSFPGS